ncbi:MAG: cupin domain-containing protein [Chlorobi bacterium]|nr:cupin domain-containing protein [Chlorobiota bacterium]
MSDELFSNEEMKDRISLYIIGAMTSEEVYQFEQDLIDGKIDMIEFKTQSENIASFAEEIAESMPLPRLVLKEKILNEIGRIENGISFPILSYPLRGENIEWIDSGFPGITIRPMHLNKETGYITMMVKLLPGAKTPRHKHNGYETFFVLEGDLQTDNIEMLKGDYNVTEDGDIHVETFTKTGCIGIIQTMFQDQYF